MKREGRDIAHSRTVAGDGEKLEKAKLHSNAAAESFVTFNKSQATIVTRIVH